MRPAPTLWRARPARPVLRSSVQVPCNHSCEAIAPVRVISVHRGRNLNGNSLMHTVDRGREWPYFDVSHCSTLQSGGSAVSPTRRAAECFGSRAGFACRQSESTINKREAPEPVGDGGKPGASVQTEQSHIYRNLRSPHAEAALILNFFITGDDEDEDGAASELDEDGEGDEGRLAIKVSDALVQNYEKHLAETIQKAAEGLSLRTIKGNKVGTSWSPRSRAEK